MRAFVAFVPEFSFGTPVKKKMKLSGDLFILPDKHTYSKQIRDEIKTAGYEITGGSYLYFQGDLKGDITSYEVFYGYCLALTFFYKSGKASCRAVKEINSVEPVRLYIDKFDKFGVGPDDFIKLQIKDKKTVGVCYSRILPQLATTDFNPLRNSLEFFSSFSREYDIRVRLLYLSICLESLFLEGNDTEGVGHKLGLRCAAFLSYFDKNTDPHSTFTEVKTSYDLRSKIIHGANYQKASEQIIKGTKSKATRELDHVEIIERILKNVFHFVFLNKDFHDAVLEKNLGSKIDKELILGKN